MDIRTMFPAKGRRYWLDVARERNALVSVTLAVQRQLDRDRSAGRISVSDYWKYWDEMEIAYQVLNAEHDLAFALHSIERLNRPFEAFTASFAAEHDE